MERSPQVGFLHGEAVLVDASGGHAAAKHVLSRGDVALLGDALQVGQVAAERGVLRPSLAASLPLLPRTLQKAQQGPCWGCLGRRAPWVGAGSLGLADGPGASPSEATEPQGKAASHAEQGDPKDGVT